MSAYNIPQQMEYVLHSIRAQQTKLRYEIIVVDDGSAEPCAAACDKYGAIYHYFPDQPFYCNPAKARNIAMKWARGRVLICQSGEVVHHYSGTINALYEHCGAGHFAIARVHDCVID